MLENPYSAYSLTFRLPGCTNKPEDSVLKKLPENTEPNLLWYKWRADFHVTVSIGNEVPDSKKVIEVRRNILYRD